MAERAASSRHKKLRLYSKVSISLSTVKRPLLFCACDNTLMANYNECAGLWPDLLRHLDSRQWAQSKEHRASCSLCLLFICLFVVSAYGTKLAATLLWVENVIFLKNLRNEVKVSRHEKKLFLCRYKTLFLATIRICSFECAKAGKREKNIVTIHKIILQSFNP